MDGAKLIPDTLDMNIRYIHVVGRCEQRTEVFSREKMDCCLLRILERVRKNIVRINNIVKARVS